MITGHLCDRDKAVITVDLRNRDEATLFTLQCILQLGDLKLLIGQVSLEVKVRVLLSTQLGYKVTGPVALDL